MPRQRIHHRRDVHRLPDDFPERLRRLHEESGLPWAEITRCLGTLPHTVSRWRKGEVRPNTPHMMALMQLAGSLGLGHTLTDPPRDTRLTEVAHGG